MKPAEQLIIAAAPHAHPGRGGFFVDPRGRRGYTVSMKTLTQRTGTTLDSRGCEFRYTMHATVTGTRWTKTGRLVVVRERVYEGCGRRATTLAELRSTVGRIPTEQAIQYVRWVGAEIRGRCEPNTLIPTRPPRCSRKAGAARRSHETE